MREKKAPTRRYAAFLRGVTPMNAKMAELKRCFERAGFAEVKTVLSSGNVVFNAPATNEAVLAKQAEAAIEKGLKRTFPVIVRSLDALREILASDPFGAFRLGPDSKRVVTFLSKAPRPKPSLPIEVDGARILCAEGCEAYTAYVAGPRGPVFMTLIEKTFGKDVTTRTWDTVRKVAGA
jgi:uncharacterized protein (DUF1697 family)